MLLLATLSAALAAPLIPVVELDPGPVRDASAAIVRLPGGTGFVLADTGLVLTNAHVALASGTEATALLAWTDEDHPGEPVDLALLRSSAALDLALYGPADATVRLPRGLPLATESVRNGDPVTLLGHPGQLPQRAGTGPVLTATGELGGQPVVEYALPGWWGSSGSPVLDDAGMVIAIHVGWDATERLNGALVGRPAFVIADFIDDTDTLGREHLFLEVPAPRRATADKAP